MWRIPGHGGSYAGGGYLTLWTTDYHLLFTIYCNYGYDGNNEAQFNAYDHSITAGSVQVSVAIDGEAPRTFNDLQYGKGGQDEPFPGDHPWPWHGLFTVNDRGRIITWDVTDFGSPGEDCTVIVYTTEDGYSYISQP